MRGRTCSLPLLWQHSGRRDMRKLGRILVGDRTYPVKIDLNVLEAIQEGYGSISRFERELMGLYQGEDGTLYRGEPSVKAIRMVLPAMVNEGLAIEAAETGKLYEPVSDMEVISRCCIAYDLLAGIIHEEFKRCFVQKK